MGRRMVKMIVFLYDCSRLFPSPALERFLSKSTTSYVLLPVPDKGNELCVQNKTRTCQDHCTGHIDGLMNLQNCLPHHGTSCNNTIQQILTQCTKQTHLHRKATRNFSSVPSEWLAHVGTCWHLDKVFQLEIAFVLGVLPRGSVYSCKNQQKNQQTSTIHAYKELKNLRTGMSGAWLSKAAFARRVSSNWDVLCGLNKAEISMDLHGSVWILYGPDGSVVQKYGRLWQCLVAYCFNQSALSWKLPHWEPDQFKIQAQLRTDKATMAASWWSNSTLVEVCGTAVSISSWSSWVKSGQVAEDGVH
jgi:hypothetical protein